MITLQDTTKKMLSDDYKERFIAEYSQAYIRATKLDDLLCNWDNLDFTPKCDRELLHEQLVTMYRYVDLLETRAKIENIELPTIREF